MSDDASHAFWRGLPSALCHACLLPATDRQTLVSVGGSMNTLLDWLTARSRSRSWNDLCFAHGLISCSLMTCLRFPSWRTLKFACGYADEFAHNALLYSLIAYYNGLLDSLENMLSNLSKTYFQKCPWLSQNSSWLVLSHSCLTFRFAHNTQIHSFNALKFTHDRLAMSLMTISNWFKQTFLHADQCA